MNIFQRLEKFVSDVFKTTLEIFLEALKLSPNAQGYVSGSISELLLKKNLQELGFEVNGFGKNGKGKNMHNITVTFTFVKIQKALGLFWNQKE